MTSYRFKVVLGGWQGAPGVNTYYARFTGGVGTPEAQSFATQLAGVYNTYKGYLVPGFTANVASDVDEIDEETGNITNVLTITPPAQVTGTGIGGQIPRSTMLKWRFRTDLVHNGALVRGGNFLGPLDAASITSTGQLVPALVALAPTAWAGMLDVVGDGRLVVYSRPVKKQIPGGPAPRVGASGYVQSVSTDPVPAVLRSRRD